MAFLDEIVKQTRKRRAFMRFASAENVGFPWVGAADRRYGKVDDATDLVPVVGTVATLGSIQRSIANHLYTIELPTIATTLIDPRREWRALGGHPGHQLLFRNLSYWLRVHDDNDEIQDGRVAVGQIAEVRFPSGLQVALSCRVLAGDFLGKKVGRRFITNTDFPQAPPEVLGRLVPILIGRLHNEVLVADLTPVDSPTNPPITGSEEMRCDDLWTDDFEGISPLGNYSGGGDFSIEIGTGVGGSKALLTDSGIPEAVLTKTVSATSRTFCIEWTADHVLTPTADASSRVAQLHVFRDDTNVTIETATEILATLSDVLTPGTFQTFRLDGAFASGGNANGYVRFYIDDVLQTEILNDARIISAAPDGSWSSVGVAPSGHGDNLSIGSGIVFQPPEPGVTTPAPAPECAAGSGDNTQSGGAVEAILVGPFATDGTPTGDTPAPPVISGAVVGAGGSQTYRYVVTAIGEAGRFMLGDFSQRTNHTGESLASNIITVTGAPSRDQADLDNYVHIHWDLVPGAISYRVYGDRGSGGEFSLLDSWSGEDPDHAGKGHYNDGEIHGRREWDILKTDSHPPGFSTGGLGNQHTYVLGAHALKAVDEVYVLKDVITEDSLGSDTPIKTRQQVLMVEGRDYTHRWVDVNNNRYHILEFTEAQVSDTCEYYQVSANIQGAETNADSTGTLIENAVDVVSYLMLNWILNSYRSSIGPDAPPTGRWFTDTAYAPGLWDLASVTATRTVANRRVEGGLIAAGMITEPTEARQLIMDLLLSFDLELYFDDLAGTIGAWKLHCFEPQSVVRGSLPLYTGAEILENSFETDLDLSQVVNVLPFFAGPSTERTGKNFLAPSGGGYVIGGEIRHDDSINKFGVQAIDPIYLLWTRDAATAFDTAQRYLAYRAYPAILPSFGVGMRALTTPITTEVRITHPDGVGSTTGWTARVCRVLRSDLNLDQIVAKLQVQDIDHLVP